jgi:hypothetical protein
MSLFDKITKRNHFNLPKAAHAVFKDYFLSLEGTTDFPLELAYKNLNHLEQQSSSNSEQAGFLVEDIIFSSLIATLYENLLLDIKENPHLTTPLIEKFKARNLERELSYQVENHTQFILNGGFCSGCPSCNNHQDVLALNTYWENGDLLFFKVLFLGMTTIHISFEYILADLIPFNYELISGLTQEEILKFRQYIISYVENNFPLEGENEIPNE